MRCCISIEGDQGNANYWFHKAGKPSRKAAEIDALWDGNRAEVLAVMSETPPPLPPPLPGPETTSMRGPWIAWIVASTLGPALPFLLMGKGGWMTAWP